jgi:hypothetical protein
MTEMRALTTRRAGGETPVRRRVARFEQIQSKLTDCRGRVPPAICPGASHDHPEAKRDSGAIRTVPNQSIVNFRAGDCAPTVVLSVVFRQVRKRRVGVFAHSHWTGAGWTLRQPSTSGTGVDAENAREKSAEFARKPAGTIKVAVERSDEVLGKATVTGQNIFGRSHRECPTWMPASPRLGSVASSMSR